MCVVIQTSPGMCQDSLFLISSIAKSGRGSCTSRLRFPLHIYNTTNMTAIRITPEGIATASSGNVPACDSCDGVVPSRADVEMRVVTLDMAEETVTEVGE